MAASTAFVFCALLSLAFGGLVIVESGRSGKMGPKLKNGFSFCPEDFSNRGFSIECRLPEETRYAIITVNGRSRREDIAPYHAAGDTGDRVLPLYVPEGRIKVTCEGSTGVWYTVRGTIECEEMMPSPSPMMEISPSPEVEVSPSTEATAEPTTTPKPRRRRRIPYWKLYQYWLRNN